MCVVGPDLVRVKDLARRCNNPSPLDYQDAFNVLKRIYKRRGAAILFKKGYAGREIIPASSRPPILGGHSPALLSVPTPSSHVSQSDVLDHISVLQSDFEIPESPLPTSTRFTTVGYTDASFAVGENKDSISGFTIYVNCTPIMWGSMRQVSGADSTCSSEFVAASVCCKQLTHVENMFRFLGFLCPKPYRLYTDSQASMSIASNTWKMGKIRHIQIRYHLVRGMVLAGDVILVFCVTEDMVADLLTKIMTGSAYDHLSIRFYFLGH
jgi:hypothetical protein